MAEKVAKEEKRPAKPFSQNLQESGLGKRFLAIMFDIALFLVPSYLLSSYVIGPAYTKRDGGSYSLMQKAFSLMDETGLFTMTKSGTEYTNGNFYYFSDTGNSVYSDGSYAFSNSSLASDPANDGYLHYHDMVYGYYTVYLPKILDDPTGYHGYIQSYVDADGNAFTTKEQYRTFYYVTVMGLPSVETFNATTDPTARAALSTYYTYQVDENGNARTDVPAVLNSSTQALVDARNTDILSNLLLHFFNTSNSTYTGIYAEACYNFMGSGSKGVNQTYYSNTYNWYANESLAAFLFIYMPLLIILEFVVPFCDKYGRTLGKMIFRLRVCLLLDNGEGVVMKKWQNAMRSGYMTAILSPIGIYTLAPFVIGFLFLISYFVLMLGKRHQSLHDMFLHTVVVEKKGSKIYDSPEAYADELEAQREEERKNLYRPPEILDLSTINQARELAAKYESFDELEEQDIEVKTYDAKKASEKARARKRKAELPPDEEDFEDDPLGLGDDEPQDEIRPEDVKLNKDE